MSIRLQTAALAAGTLLLIGSGAASAQTDPGVRASLQSAPGAVDHRHERQGDRVTERDGLRADLCQQ